MASENGSENAALKARLLETGGRYAFFQAWRLLRLMGQAQPGTSVDIRVRPNLTLDFPGTDLSSIEQLAPNRYRLTANFLGLYGVTSPLPNFVTEDLLEEQHEGRHSNRDFLDIINQTIYPLFFRAWLKSRAHLRIREFGDDRLLEIFHTFVGINEPLRLLSRPGFSHLLRFAGLFSQFPRSAMGLQTIVSALYPAAKVDVVQQDERWQPIAPDQQFHLGVQATTLGEDAHLGKAIRSRSSNLTIRLGDVGVGLFLSLLPGEEEFRKLQFLVRYYLLDPLDIQLDLRLKPGVVRPLALGERKWSNLGRDTWLVHEGYTDGAQLKVAL